MRIATTDQPGRFRPSTGDRRCERSERPLRMESASGRGALRCLLLVERLRALPRADCLHRVQPVLPLGGIARAPVVPNVAARPAQDVDEIAVAVASAAL